MLEKLIFQFEAGLSGRKCTFSPSGSNLKNYFGEGTQAPPGGQVKKRQVKMVDQIDRMEIVILSLKILCFQT